jgi:hypothetical protein
MKMQFGKLVVLGAVLAASASFASADTITLGSFGSAGISGYSPTITGLSNTAVMYVNSDQVTTVAAIPATPVFGVPPTPVEAVDLNPNGVWAGPLGPASTPTTGPTSSWVGINSTAGPQNTVNPQYGYYEFTTTFTAGSTGTYAGNLDVYADDTTEVLINGVVIPSLSFGALGMDQHCADGKPTCLLEDNQAVALSLNAGVNTLTFIVEQAGTGPVGGTNDPSGFDFDGTLNLVPAPEPNSLILLGTGLLGAAGMLVRKRQIV